MNLLNDYNFPVDLEYTNFRDIDVCHDWKRYVPDILITNWRDLTLREKYIIYIMSHIQAMNEEYD